MPVVETISPQRAQEYLATMGRNRKVRPTHVATLAQAMRDGTFHYTGDPIRFTWHGELFDGQHRLLACIETGIPLVASVLRGLDPKTMDVVDTGLKRSPGDIFGLKGYTNANHLTATLRWLWRFDHGHYVSYPRKPQVSELEETMTQHPGMLASLPVGPACMKLLHKSLASALHTLCAEKYPQVTATFFDQLAKGEGLFRGDPVYLLRTRLLRNATSKAKLPDPEVAALTIKAFNAYVAGRRLNTLKWVTEGEKVEPFPEIL